MQMVCSIRDLSAVDDYVDIHWVSADICQSFQTINDLH